MSSISSAQAKSLQIKVLDKSHLLLIMEIEKKSFKKPWTHDGYAQLFEQKNYMGFGVFYGNKMAGFCFFYFVLDELHIVNIAIDPALRRQKLATTLLLYIEAWAVKKGLKKIFLEVSVENLAGVALYENIGFMRQSRRMKYYPDGKDAILMVKEL